MSEDRDKIFGAVAAAILFTLAARVLSSFTASEMGELVRAWMRRYTRLGREQ